MGSPLVKLVDVVCEVKMRAAEDFDPVYGVWAAGGAVGDTPPTLQIGWGRPVQE